MPEPHNEFMFYWVPERKWKAGPNGRWVPQPSLFHLLYDKYKWFRRLAHWTCWLRENLPSKYYAYVGVYHTTRHYGGPEEGGWRYDWNEWIDGARVPLKMRVFAGSLMKSLWKEHKEAEYGDISSVLGGIEVHVEPEKRPREHETGERPRYE